MLCCLGWPYLIQNGAKAILHFQRGQYYSDVWLLTQDGLVVDSPAPVDGTASRLSADMHGPWQAGAQDSPFVSSLMYS